MALIPSKDVPQADVLDDVVRSIEAVSSGARSFQTIGRAISKGERQGRYYRRAAEILGFIENRAGRNLARLTPSGRQFLAATLERKSELLAAAVLNSSMIQRVIPFLEVEGTVTKEKLTEFITNLTEKARKQNSSTTARRMKSVVGWLTKIGMLSEDGNYFRFIPKVPLPTGILDYQSPDEPLLPREHELTEYAEVARRVRSAAAEIQSFINVAAHERAGHSHTMLTNLVAKKIREAGSVPKRNKYVDLAARIGEKNFIFEMKSSTDKNVHAQIRKGLSQLYEYKYIQKAMDANLVLVIERQLPHEAEWLTEYLVSDRSVLFAWNGDGHSLNCPHSIRRNLEFLL